MGVQIKTPFINITIGKDKGKDRPGTHKVGGNKVYNGMDSQYQDAKSSLEQLQELKEKVQNNPNMSDSEKRAALATIERGISAATEALDYSTNGGQYDTTSGSRDGDADMGAARAALTDAHMAIAGAQDDLQAATLTPLTTATAVPPPNKAYPVDGTSTAGAAKAGGADGNSGASGTSQSSASGSSKGPGAIEFGGKSVDQMMEMMNNDPQGLMDHLDGLDTKDRQNAMQMIQQRLQQINQMFSMLSNMQKAAHDTAKASINNMRV